jgi:hypothetical protein
VRSIDPPNGGVVTGRRPMGGRSKAPVFIAELGAGLVSKDTRTFWPPFTPRFESPFIYFGAFDASGTEFAGCARARRAV